MRGISLNPWLHAAIVDFECDSCPNLPSASLPESAEGTWFTVNLCQEGRCEVTIPGRGFAVVGVGDCCLSCTEDAPQAFSYPTGFYKGVELFINTQLVDASPAFALFRSAHCSLDEIASQAGFASVFSGDSELNGHLTRIGLLIQRMWCSTQSEPGGPTESAAASSDLGRAQCEFEVLGLLLRLAQRDIAHAKPRSLLTPHQIAIARSVREAIEPSLYEKNDVRTLAPSYGISASTLNRYFETFYGMTVSAYVRHRRVQKACELLELGLRVAEVSAAVGYSNPSKFAAAFKRETDMTPTEYRRVGRLSDASL